MDGCKKSAKYQMSKAARLPQVPGAGLIKPTPNQVAKR